MNYKYLCFTIKKKLSVFLNYIIINFDWKVVNVKNPNFSWYLCHVINVNDMSVTGFYMPTKLKNDHLYFKPKINQKDVNSKLTLTLDFLIMKTRWIFNQLKWPMCLVCLVFTLRLVKIKKIKKNRDKSLNNDVFDHNTSIYQFWESFRMKFPSTAFLLILINLIIVQLPRIFFRIVMIILLTLSWFVYRNSTYTLVLILLWN